MALYEVGSIASFVSQTSSNSKEKQEANNNKSNKNVLNELFASASAVATTVEHVPIPSEKKVKKKKRKNDQYNITNLPGGKKLKVDAEEDLDDDDIEKALDFDNDDPYENDEDEEDATQDVGRKLKKVEIKNLKKNSMINKGLPKPDMEGVILVKNLPIKVKRRAIQHLFAKFGKIDAVWLRCAALADQAMPKKVAVIKQEFNPNRKSISAFVRFEQPESAVEALSLTGSEFQEQHIAVSLCSEGSKKERSKAIFVGNLPFGVEDEPLWTHFAECGKIQDVRIVRDNTNGLGKGFGYVNFDSADAVELALKLNGSMLCDRAIRVDRCKNKPKPKILTQNSENEKKSGAYRRVQEKNKNNEKKKGSGWISKMKQRQKASQSQSSTKLQSFAGETTSDNGKNQKVVRTGKMIKKTKEDQRKKSIAAKLAPKS